MQGVDIDSLLNSGLDLDNLDFPPSSFPGDFSSAASTSSVSTPISTSAAAFSSFSVSSSVNDLSSGPSPGMSAESRARSLLERETQAQGLELGQGGETEVDLDDQFDVYHRTKTEHVRRRYMYPHVYPLLYTPCVYHLTCILFLPILSSHR